MNVLNPKVFKFLAVTTFCLFSFGSLAQALTYEQLLNSQGRVLGAATSAFVQNSDNVVYSGNSVTAVFGSNVTANNLIVVVATATQSITNITASCVTGNLNVANSWFDGGLYYFAMAYGIANSSGSCSVTANASAGTQGMELAPHEISGIATASPLDGQAYNITLGSSATPSSGNITTTQNGDYIFGFQRNNNGVSVSAAGSGFTPRATGLGFYTEDQIQPSAGPVAATVTMNSSGGNFVVGVMAFKAAASAPADTTAPSVPTGLSATAISQSVINLSWTASTDNVGVIGYKIFRGGSQIGTSATNSYSDTGLIASTQYTYTVSAYDTAGNNSAQSSSSSATTQSPPPPDTTPPSIPTGLTATAISSSAINLSWTVSTDNIAVAGYKVYRGGVQIGDSATNNYSDSGLTASTPYTYTISAYDAAGNNSSQSSSASATTQAQQQSGGSGPWSGILSPSRAIDWSKAGLPATLPDGETTPNPWTPPTRTQCGATVNPSGLSNGTDVTNINNAIAACAPGHYVLLAPGTFYIQSANNCYGGSQSCIAFFNPATGTTARNGVTLRGSGADVTSLKFVGSAAIEFSISSNIGSCSWTGGYAPGVTTLTVASCTGPALAPGMIIHLNQCDSGWSGTNCTTGSSMDDGGLYVCKNGPCAQQVRGGTNNMQDQTVLVTGVSGNTITIAAPGIYMPNWLSTRTPTVSWPQFQTYGDAIEDLTVSAPGGSSATYLLSLGTSYGSWVKGVRFLGSGNNALLGVQASKNILVANNYLFSDIAIDANYPPPVQTDSSSDVLILNNILSSSVPWEGNGGNEGNVFAYNYARDTFTAYMENILFDHAGGSAFFLTEGNQLGGILDDDTWATDNLNTSFRNYLSGWDPPFLQQHPRGFMVDDYHRFVNAIGNSIGSQYITTYQGSGDSTAFRFLGNDPLTLATSMRWGNCDTATGSCRFQPSEIPTTLPGNAVPFANPVPGSNALPASFFMPTTAHPGGGTGLSWWKVCTNWANFPTNCASTQTQSFPPVGPDVTGGPYVSGHAYDIPAAIAWKNLPIDSSFQNSYPITGSSWSNGTETLTVSGLPNTTHLMGGFQITGVPACNTPAASEYLITVSTATTISYALASNPGLCSGGTFKFPDVRMFNEAVYQTDSGGSSGGGDTTAPTVPTGLSATAISSSAINLSWTASTDNVGVTGYKIYRSGSQIGTSAANSYSDTGLAANTGCRTSPRLTSIKTASLTP